MTSWAYFPSKCSLDTFDAFRLSRKLAGREVLVAGDSLIVSPVAACCAAHRAAVARLSRAAWCSCSSLRR